VAKYLVDHFPGNDAMTTRAIVLWAFPLLFAVACGSSDGGTETPVVSCTVTSVSVTPAAPSVAVNQTVALTAAIVRQNCPADAPDWASDASEVAVVSSNGVVTGVSAGTSRITATVRGVQGSALVTVTPCLATGVTLTPTAATVTVGATTTLTAAITPGNCTTATVTWASQSNAIATVNNGVVTGVSPGTVSITGTSGTAVGTAVITVQAPALGTVWDQSVLRVAGSADAPNGYFTAAWAASSTDVFAVSSYTYHRYNGTVWSVLPGNPFGVAALFGFGPNDVFAVGQVMRRWNGTAWTELNAPTSAALHDVWGSGTSNLFAVGNAGTIVRFNGTAWTTMSSPVTTALRAVFGTGATAVYAVGDGGVILRYDGTTWTAMTSPVATQLTGVWFAGPTSGFAVGVGGLLRYNGTSWTVDNTLNTNGQVLRRVWGTSSTDVYVSGTGGFTAHFDGSGWTAHTPRTTTDFRLLTGSGSAMFAFGNGTAIRATGATTSLLVSAPELRSVWAVDANTAFAVGADGVIWKYTNGTWQLQNTGTLATFESVVASSATDALAIGSDLLTGTAVAYRLNGTTWQPINTAGADRFTTAFGTSTNNVIIGSRFLPLYRYNGTTITNATGVSAGDYERIGGTGTTDYLLVGGAGYAARFDGTTVTPITTGTTRPLVSVWGISPSNYFVGTNGSDFFRYNGTTFTPMSIAGLSTVYGIWGNSPTQVFAVDYNGAVARFDGTQWTKIRDGVSFALFNALHGSATRLFSVGPNGVVMVTR
jgi:hypothetical protein